MKYIIKTKNILKVFNYLYSSEYVFEFDGENFTIEIETKKDIKTINNNLKK